MKAFVANPTRRKAKKKQQRRHRGNPLPLVVMNPFHRRNKMAKKRKRNKAGAGLKTRSRRVKNPMGFRRRHRRNPYPETMQNAVKIVFSSAAGLLGSVYIPGWLLGLFGKADTGLFSYVAAALVAFVPPALLEKYPNLAKGWLAGGGAGLVWRVVDDLTGNKYLTISSGTGMGSFNTTQSIALPGQNLFGQYGRRPQLSAASPAALSAPVGKGMGYVKYPFAA
jgi:hypothetical protein